MTIVFSDINEQGNSVLENKPYKILTEEYQRIRNDIDGQEICINNLSEKKEGFYNGFFVDELTQNPTIKFSFYKSQEQATLIQMEYSFRFNDDSECIVYQRRMKALRQRIPYFYLPFAGHVEFSHSIENKFIHTFTVLAKDEDKILDCCYCLLSLIIAIFSFDD